MDVVTAIGLTVALAELIRSSGGVQALLQKFKEDNSEFRELASDVAIFSESLKGCDRVLRSRHVQHGISPAVIHAAITESQMIVSELQRILAEIPGPDNAALRKLRWIQNKAHFKRLHHRFKGQITMLRSFVELAHVETLLTVCRNHPNMMQQLLVSTTNPAENFDYGTPLESVSSNSSTLVPGAASSSASMTSTAQATSPSPARSSTLVDQPHHSPHGTPSWRVCHISALAAPGIRRSCRFDCYCVCHSEEKALSSKKKKKGLAPTCNDPSCAGAKAAEPSKATLGLFHKLLAEILCSRSVKVRYDLRTYRTVPEGCDAMRYTKLGDLEKLKGCFDRGEATIWDVAPDGWSLLHTASYQQQVPVIKYLLELGADKDGGNIGTHTPFDLAIRFDFGTTPGLIEKQILDLFAPGDDYLLDMELTPIHIAVLGLYDLSDKERPTLEQLLDLVDDANNAPAGTDWKEWMLRYRNRSPLFTQVLGYFRAAADEQPYPAKIIQNLIDKLDRKYCWAPIHWAASAGKTDEMRILLHYGADPFILTNMDGNLLHVACETKSIAGLLSSLEICKRYPQQLQIDHQNRWGETPLHKAAWFSPECVQILLGAGADRNIRQEDGQIALHSASYSPPSDARRDITMLLCQGGAMDINAQDSDGRPPMFEFLNDPECLKMLVGFGAKIDLTDYNGRGIFHHACLRDEVRALRVLFHLAPGSKMAIAKDSDGNTPLLLALSQGSKTCAMALLDLDDVGEAVGSGGWALVHYAAKLGDASLLKVVLEHSSFQRGMKTICGKTPATIAMEAGHWSGEVKTLLRKYDNLV